MALVHANGLPIALSLHGAGPHEVGLCFGLVQGCWTEELPERVIGDKAYDSDALDERMWEEMGVEMIAAHRKGRKAPPTQDGRRLRRAKRRWKVERFFAWMQNYRRLCLRWERKTTNFFGFVLLSAIIMHIKNAF